jgi:NADH-quinone oxidoreductase subunit J
MDIAFYLAAAVALVSTVMVITRLNAVHALLYMILSLLSVAIIFYTLGAPYIAALEVITYAGAIMVLFVFVVMLLNLGPQTISTERQWLRPRAWIGPGILAVILLAELIYLTSGTGTLATGTEITPKQVSVALFGTYLLGVELASMLLLAGLVGAYHLGRRMEEPVSQSPTEPELDNSGLGD